MTELYAKVASHSLTRVLDKFAAQSAYILFRQSPKAISIKEYTNLLVFIVQLLRCNNSYIVNDAPAARLESERKSCAIRYIFFCQSPKHGA
ncbi:MAG: hypothetical protein BECKG1743F_GA0114225_101617 [Candidatus Kentron sp. G]|nr:MAG: hypothetical protein BECKG1743F_GA0114225_101617 [Candidatus Kentron sp. G]VFM98063.1 MAG: hypothetical protein BECKG1743E_GA0114224_101657 [Candidatus Kentron sp. G]